MRSLHSYSFYDCYSSFIVIVLFVERGDIARNSKNLPCASHQKHG